MRNLFSPPVEEEVCSFELSKRLKELGVPQRSIFFWQELAEGNIRLGHGQHPDSGDLAIHHCVLSFEYSAFTVNELGEMLPYYFSSEKHSKQWRVGMIKEGKADMWGAGRKEADARANAKIYLIENKIDHL